MLVDSRTRLIRVSDKKYPVYLYDLRNDNPNSVFSDEMADTVVAAFGYEVVHLVDKPAGDVITEVDPLLVNGIWKQQWQVRAYTEEEKQAILISHRDVLLNQATRQFETELAVGIPYEFTIDGAKVTYHVQAMSKDRMNLHGLKALAEKAIAGGAPRQHKLRVYENLPVMLQSQEVLDVYYATMEAYEKAFDSFWEYKDMLDAAHTKEDLIDVPSAFIVTKK